MLIPPIHISEIDKIAYIKQNKWDLGTKLKYIEHNSNWNWNVKQRKPANSIINHHYKYGR